MSYKKYYMKNSDFFNKSGRRRPGAITQKYALKPTSESPTKSDAENRATVLKEIQERCKQGELLDTVVNEIAQREEVKENFSYFKKTGLMN